MVSTTLGVAAATWGVIMAVSPILQVRETLRRGSSDGISVTYLGVLLVGFVLWVSYGLARNDLPLVIPNSIALLVMACTIGVMLGKR